LYGQAMRDVPGTAIQIETHPRYSLARQSVWMEIASPHGQLDSLELFSIFRVFSSFRTVFTTCRKITAAKV